MKKTYSSKKTIKVHSVRTITSPSNRNIKTYMVMVNFMDLPDDFSLDVNPRKPKMTTNVAKQLIKSVISIEDDAFDINNRGIVITAKDFKFDNKKSIITLDMGNNVNKYGILDGGHTYRAIIENREELLKKLQNKLETKNVSINKYVRLEIVVGEELNTTALADARNTSLQVSDIALYELDNKFDIIKKALFNEKYSDDIAYKDNDNKRIPVIELLKLMYIFNIDKYPDDTSVPMKAYTAKSFVFKDYRDTLNQNNNIYEKLSLILPTLIELYEYIEKDLFNKYNYYKEIEKTKGSFGRVRGVEGKGVYKTLFKNENKCYEIPVGYILPIFGAFRALLEKDNNDQLKWVFNPIEVWEEEGYKLVQNVFENKSDPQSIGKNRMVWQSNYRIIDNAKQSRQLKILQKQLDKNQI